MNESPVTSHESRPLDPRAELVAAHQAALAAGNNKQAMDILLRIAKVDAVMGRVRSLELDPDPLPDSFATQTAIVAYLDAEGWNANKSTLSYHIGERELIPEPDGTFSRVAVDRYAIKKLVNKTLRAEKTEIDELNIESRQIENRRNRLKTDQLEGKLIDREEVKRDLENMLVTFRSQLLLIPRVLSAQLSQMSDAHQIEALLNGKMRDILTTLSQYSVLSDTVGAIHESPLPGIDP